MVRLEPGARTALQDSVPTSSLDRSRRVNTRRTSRGCGSRRRVQPSSATHFSWARQWCVQIAAAPPPAAPPRRAHTAPPPAAPLIQDEDDLAGALRYATALLGELRISLLGPQRYYELYMQASAQRSAAAGPLSACPPVLTPPTRPLARPGRRPATAPGGLLRGQGGSRAGRLRRPVRAGATRGQRATAPVSDAGRAAPGACVGVWGGGWWMRGALHARWHGWVRLLDSGRGSGRYQAPARRPRAGIFCSRWRVPISAHVARPPRPCCATPLRCARACSTRRAASS
jgi:hypothetical protein